MPATTTPHRHSQTPDLTSVAIATRRPMSQSDAQQILSIRDLVPQDDAQRFIAHALHDIRAFMQEHDLSPAGPPFSICRPRGDELDIEAGWPTATKPLTGTSRIHSGSLPRALIFPCGRPSGWNE